MKSKLFAALLIIATFWGVTSIQKQSQDCTNILVDFGSLDHNTKLVSCVNSDGKESALSLLSKAGVSIDGTQKYGLQVVCRVNSLPGANRESCETMPPEDAYWAVIIKQDDSAISIKKDWNWAQTGISDVYLEPGDSLGLVFIENEEMRWPD